MLMRTSCSDPLRMLEGPRLGYVVRVATNLEYGMTFCTRTASQSHLLKNEAYHAGSHSKLPYWSYQIRPLESSKLPDMLEHITMRMYEQILLPFIAAAL